MRPVQYFSDEQLAHGRKMKPEQVIQFLEDFRELHGARPARSSTLISLRVPDALLRVFRARAAAAGLPYQTQIKRLMQKWVE